MPRGETTLEQKQKAADGVRNHMTSPEHITKTCGHYTETGKKRHRAPLGSRRIKQGRWYVRTENGWEAEHRLVMTEKLGRPLVEGEVVHHINNDARDNRPENLEVLTNSEHIRRHSVHAFAGGLGLWYIEWRDAVGKSHYSTPEQAADLSSVVLRGITVLLEETEEDLIVAAFVASDGGAMDLVAIPHKSVLTRRKIRQWGL